MGVEAFNYCDYLKSVSLNEGLEKLGEKEIINSEKVEGEVFSDTAIKSIRLPSTLKRVEARMFESCQNLKRVEIPSGVEYIGTECFMDSGIKKITLPDTLKKIGKDAFDDCPSLRTVWVEEGCTLNIRKYVGDGVEVRHK